MDLRLLDNFVRNVDLILADVDIESVGGHVDLYFDTADVRGAALGMHAFYGMNNLFDERLFALSRVLVQCLAASGHLGSIQLLGSHQAEFLSLINVDFGLRHDMAIVDLASRFLKDAGILEEHRSLPTLSKEDLQKLVAEQAGNAPRFFKAVECIRGTWQTRLKDWRAREILLISRTTENIGELISSELFSDLKAKLNERRPERPVNNFADAVALASLIRKVDEFRAGRSNVFPCFYAATSLFQEVVESVNCGDRLHAALPSGRRAPVLRGSDYFVLRAIFRASRQIAGSAQEVFLSADELREMHEQVRDILDVQSALAVDRLGEMKFSDRSLSDLVASVQHLSFFESVWLPYRGEKDIQRSIRRVKALAVREDKLRPGLENAVKQVRADLEKNAEGFRSVRFLFEQIPARYRSLSKSLERHMENPADLIRWTGLLRFAIPQPVQTMIFNAITALVGIQDQAESSAAIRVVRSYLKAREDLAKSVSDAELAAAILWVANFDPYIVRMLGGRERPHPSLDLMYAAAAIRSGEDLMGALETMKSLEKKRRGERKRRERADLAMGLAYLYYHVWTRAKAMTSVSRAVSKALRLRPSELIERAVERATEAYKDLKDLEPTKRVYALNQMLYCMTQAKSFADAQMKSAADALASYSALADVWQYRFDETLAQYYLLLAKKIRSAAEAEQLLRLGSSRAQSALNEAPDDPEVRTTAERFTLELATIRVGTSGPNIDAPGSVH